MRLWAAGRQLEVTPDALGAPRALWLDGQWHQVVEVVTRWRIRQHWWRAPLWREYFTVATGSQLLLTVYRELPGGVWWLESVFD